MRIFVFLFSAIFISVVSGQGFQFDQWYQWSNCDKTCGGGQRSRAFICSGATPPPNAPAGVERCAQLQTENCNEDPCPIDGGVSEWGNWSVCNATCGGGTQERTRQCDDPPPQYGGKDCNETLIATKTCADQPCPIDGGISTWLEWSTCSLECGTGVRSRERKCDSPAPQYGGMNCPQNLTEEENCNTDPCPIDGGVSEWGNWSVCPVTCNGGTQVRTRQCDDPPPQYGGKDCNETLTATKTCADQPCPINGNVSEWASWSDCSVSCNTGSRTRERLCDNPAPQYNGDNCTQHLEEDENCNTNPCPIDGGIGEWSNWTECSQTCGGGMQMRSRECDSPAPAHGGANCTNTTEETASCHVDVVCPAIDGGVGEWSEWSDCSQTCSDGVRERHRRCDSPAPAYNGSDCMETLEDEEPCSNNVTCPPIDGGVGNWTEWSECSKSCESGTKSRTRVCDNPTPAYNGSDCTEILRQTAECNEHPCATVQPVKDGAVGLSAAISTLLVACLIAVLDYSV